MVLAGVEKTGRVKGMKITENMKEKYNEALFYWKNYIYPQNFDLEMDFVPVLNSRIDAEKEVDTQGLYVLRLRVKLNSKDR